MDRYKKDVLWLGEEEALLGPAIRAALGILIEIDDWTWWDDPSRILDSLERAVPRHSLVKWGGDSSVVDADQWIDPQRAAKLGRAFNELQCKAPLTIKLVRDIWGWPDGAKTVDIVTLEMSQLLGSGHVFPEWERNTKPRFPIVPRSQQGRCVITSLNPLPYTLIEAVGDYVEWRPDALIADIVVANSIDTLYMLKAARLVILYGQSFDVDDVSRLRGHLSVQCVVHVEADEASLTHWLKIMICTWAEWGDTFARSIENAMFQTGLSTRVLSSTQSFLLGRDTFSALTTVEDRQRTKEYRLVVRKDSPPSRVLDLSLFDEELTGQVGSDDFESIDSTGNTYSSRTKNLSSRRSYDYPTISRESSPAYHVGRPKMVRPGPPVERILNARASQGLKEIVEWPNYGVVEISVEIIVKTPLRDRGDSPSFPDDRVEWDGERKLLQVHMFEVGRQPESQTLDLSRTGDSTAVTFIRESDAGQVDLRFLVSDGARILQTARFQTAPGEKISFFIENIVTPIHRTKTPFDIALLMNDSLGNQPSVAIITGSGKVLLVPLSENGIGLARDDLLQTLQEAVVNPNAPLSPLLLELANSGAMLRTYLQKLVPDWPSCESRIQLVTQSEVFFPIEYLYDGKLPESPNAEMCHESRRCLMQGKAITLCSIREAGEQLCPMGFLGISGIVERHTWKAGEDPRLWGTPGENKSNRHRIEDLSTIAFTASDMADDFANADLKSHEIVRIANIEKSLGVKNIPNWSGWKSNLAQYSPSMLLLLGKV